MSETVRSIWDDQILPIETVSISSDTNPHRGEKKAGRGQGRGGEEKEGNTGTCNLWSYYEFWQIRPTHRVQNGAPTVP